MALLRRTPAFVAAACVTALLSTGTPGLAAAPKAAPAHHERAAQSGWNPKPFAKKWARHANQRDWRWIRAHSVMATNRNQSAVRISEIKWLLRDVNHVEMRECGAAYEPTPSTRNCWGWNAENILVKRKKSGQKVVLNFWVED